MAEFCLNSETSLSLLQSIEEYEERELLRVLVASIKSLRRAHESLPFEEKVWTTVASRALYSWNRLSEESKVTAGWDDGGCMPKVIQRPGVASSSSIKRVYQTSIQSYLESTQMVECL